MGANTYLTERERDILESTKVGIAGAGGLGSNTAIRWRNITAFTWHPELNIQPV